MSHYFGAVTRWFWSLPAVAWLLGALAFAAVTSNLTGARRLEVLAVGVAVALAVGAVAVMSAVRFRPGAKLATGAVALTLAAGAFAGFAAFATRPEREVARTYTAFLHAIEQRDARATCSLRVLSERDLSSGDPRGRCIRSTAHRWRNQRAGTGRELDRIDVVDRSVDGDKASASIRLDGCTLVSHEGFFVRGDDGAWRYDHGPTGNGTEPVCEERDAVPPASARTATATPEPRWLSAQKAAKQLAQYYPAFERARSTDGKIELPEGTINALQRRGYTPYLEQSRLVGRLGESRAYAFPADFRDTANPCLVIFIAGEAGDVSCGVHTDAADKPLTAHVTVPDGSVALTMFLAGVTSAELELQDGSAAALDLEDGAAFTELRDEPHTLRWIDDQGRWSRTVE
jgi:hypothetical protein